MKTPIKFILSFALLLLAAADIAAQELITNVYGRDVQSLNGKWDAIVDLYDQGRKNKIYLNRKPEGKTDSTNIRSTTACGSTFPRTGTVRCPS